MEGDGTLKALILKIGLVAAITLAAASAALAKSSSPSASTDAGTCMGATPTIIGTAGNDIINGTSGDDVIVGLGGNDQINGGGGNDTICGGDGNDTIDGGDDNDSIDGGAGMNVITGGAGDDVIIGGADSETLKGGPGNDRITSNGGRDSIDGEDGQDLIVGGPDAAVLHGGAGNDIITGGAANDSIYGDDGNDQIDGGAGNDLIYGLAGDDRLAGGPGNDSISGGDGNDTIRGGDGRDSLTGDAGRDAIDGQADNDTVSGGADDDFVAGGSGSDTVTGNAGNDIVDGGPDPDTLDGGDGTDICRQETPGDNTIANCEKLNDSSRYETTNGLRQYVVAAQGGTLTWNGYSLQIPAAAMSEDCWAAISLIPGTVPSDGGQDIANLVDFDIDCPWKGQVQIGVPLEDPSVTADGTVIAHYDDIQGTWTAVPVETVANGIAYAHVSTLSPYSALGLNKREGQWCTALWFGIPYHMGICIGAWWLGKKATAARVKYYGPDVDNDRGNAFKHCVLSFLLTKAYGAGIAKTVGDNHEDVGPDEWTDDSTPYGLRAHMDLWNNAVGRSLAGGTDNYMACAASLIAGDLRYLPDYQHGLVSTAYRPAPYTPPSLQTYTTTPGPVPPGSHSVILSKGSSAQGRPGCTVAACAYMVVTGRGFTPNTSVTVECGSDADGIWYSYYARVGADGTTTTASCYFGYPGQVAWARINGIESNHVTW